MTGARPTLIGQIGVLAICGSFALVAFASQRLHEVLPWLSGSPALTALGALAAWAGVLFAVAVFVQAVSNARESPWGRFAFGEQIEVTLIEGWHALLSWGEVLSYRERGAGVELHTTRPPPRPNKAGLLPDLPQNLWVPTRDQAERQELLRLLRVKKIRRLP